MNNKVKGIPFAEVKAAALADPTVLDAYLREQAALSNRVDVEMFIMISMHKFVQCNKHPQMHKQQTQLNR